MKMRPLLALICGLAIAGSACAESNTKPDSTASLVVHHDLFATVDPATHRLRVRDKIWIPGALVKKQTTFTLNADLRPATLPGGIILRKLKSRTTGEDVGIDREDQGPTTPVRVNLYQLEGTVPGKAFSGELVYEGVIDNPVKELDEEYARGFSQSPGLIEGRGIYLAGSSHWVPQFKDVLLTYTLETALPPGWKSVSQGERTKALATASGTTETWAATTPTEEVYLIAANFTEYSRDVGGVKALAFLRKPDPALADRYLEATGQYVEMYRDLLGPYPYSKFALVENFWETGYGMPSFTLLGEQVIRFPFILHSSYPHELLHNWWGNGVFVDFSGGNWCEGLTAYLADHLIAEQRGQGGDHRRDILQQVTDYVTPETDFPLTHFRSRYNSVTAAIGYGKTAMVFNMLREKVGDKAFVESLRLFYRDNRFRVAGFDDIRRSFETVTGQSLQPFFDQWIKATGIPELKLENVSARGNQLELTLTQVQQSRRFALDVPVVIQTTAGLEIRTLSLAADKDRVQARFDLSAPPQRVEVDPQFQVYRRLSPWETPPSLSKAFGAGKVLIVTAAGSSPRYEGLLKAWHKEGVEVVDDSSLTSLPADRAVWLLGAGNRFAPLVSDSLKGFGAALGNAFAVDGTAYSAAEESLVVAVRHPQNPASVIVYLSAPSETAANALARKLPHYGKYSWLVFAGDDATNAAKGEWATGETPLAHNLVPDALPIKLRPRRALAELPPAFDERQLQRDVEWLAAPEREGRGVGTAGLDSAADYIAERFSSLGLDNLLAEGKSGNERFFQRFSLDGEQGKPVDVKNVIGVVRGSNPAFEGQALIISAHYDHLGYGWPDSRSGAKGQLHPGADDNASGVAILLEIARLTAKAKPERSVIFAAFTGEEAGLRGARYYVRQAQGSATAFPLSGHIANLNVDTVGRLGDGKLTVFGAGSAREWPFIFMGASAVTGVATSVVTQAVDASDHTAFSEAGVPAVQLFASSASDYHKPSDTADKIDYPGLAKVAGILKEATDYLASRPEPLAYVGALPSASAPAISTETRQRRAATGIVPDMTDEGVGVRIAGVQPGSGAEKAGLRSGDRLLSLGGRQTGSLKALSEALKDFEPGEAVRVEYLRDTSRLDGTLELGAR